METNSLLHNFACRERHTTLSKDKGQAASCIYSKSLDGFFRESRVCKMVYLNNRCSCLLREFLQDPHNEVLTVVAPAY